VVIAVPFGDPNDVQPAWEPLLAGTSGWFRDLLNNAFSMVTSMQMWPTGSETGAFKFQQQMEQHPKQLQNNITALNGPANALPQAWDAPATINFIQGSTAYKA
jgi:hypothetical protein